MRTAKIFYKNIPVGVLIEGQRGKEYRFVYDREYAGEGISLTMPVSRKPYAFDGFPPFFDGLLPEGMQLQGLLRQKKIDANDLFSQLCAVGAELPGAVTVEEME